MSALLVLALIIGVPIAASKGVLYRGAWAGIAVITFMLAVKFGMAHAPPDTPGSIITNDEVKQWLFNTLIFISFASFLAICFYRETEPRLKLRGFIGAIVL